jgi:hypothetical protein
MKNEQTSQHFPTRQPISHQEMREISSLNSRRNARVHSPGQIALIAKSLQRFGWVTPVLIDEDHTVLAGYGRILAAKEIGLSAVPVLVAHGWSDAEKRAYMLADNQIALQAGWDEELLALELNDLKLVDFPIDEIGFDLSDIKNLDDFGSLTRPVGNLRDQFILPPFSVLDTRVGWWQDRKRAWLALGIQSELGRGTNALRYSSTILEPDPKKRLQNATAGSQKLSHENLDGKNATVRSRKLSHLDTTAKHTDKYGERL